MLVQHVDAVDVGAELAALDEVREGVGGVGDPRLVVEGFEGVVGAAVADGDEDFDVHVHVEALLLEAFDGFGGDLGEVPSGPEDAVGGVVVVVVVGGEGEGDLVLLQELIGDEDLLEGVVEGVLTENGQHCLKERV